MKSKAEFIIGLKESALGILAIVAFIALAHVVLELVPFDVALWVFRE